MKKPHTCAFHESHDPETMEPTGPPCGRSATEEIHWKDGRVSPACVAHGMQALDAAARALVTRVTCPASEDQWMTTG